MCKILHQPSNCDSCLTNSTSNIYSWCLKPGFCFINLNNSNAESCAHVCADGVANILQQCDALNQNQNLNQYQHQTQLVITLIILIIIPFVVVLGCIFVLMFRSRMQLNNKVGPNMENEYIEEQINEPIILFRPQSNPFLAEIHGDNLRPKIPDYPTASASIREPPITAEAKIISDESKVESSATAWPGSLSATVASGGDNNICGDNPSETGNLWDRVRRGISFSPSTTHHADLQRNLCPSFSIILSEQSAPTSSSSSTFLV